MIETERLLPTEQDIRVALGSRVLVSPDPKASDASAVGEVLRTAAVHSAYRLFRGRLLVEEQERPLTVSALALLFDQESTASRTFEQVAQAAHLRSRIQQVNVAVETVVGRGALVSYWGYAQLGAMIVVVTIDTVDAKEISVADLRSVLTSVARRMELAQSAGAP